MSANKFLILSLITLLLASLLVLTVVSVTVQAASKPSVPQFTVKFVDSYYDIPPSTTTTIDTYTGQEITLNIPGNIVHSHIEVTIKNQPFTPTKDSNGRTQVLKYRVESKGHFGEDWTLWSQADPSDSQYTIVSKFTFSHTVGQVDFRVEAVIGHMEFTMPDSLFSPLIFVPAVSSGWSKVQTLTLTGSSPSSQPTDSPQNPTTPPDNNQPQQPDPSQPSIFGFQLSFLLWIATFLFVGIVVAVVLVFLRRHLKPPTYSNDSFLNQ